MKIIKEFESLIEGSKKLLKYSDHDVDIFRENGELIFGVEIKVLRGKPFAKDYPKFQTSVIERPGHQSFLIRTDLDNQEELELFSSLIEYILFEIRKSNKVKATDIQKHIDHWLMFSKGKKKEISLEKQIGLIGEVLVLEKLAYEIEGADHLNNWIGPQRSKIDFVFSDRFGVEVKSRIQPFKDWVGISSPEQLDNALMCQHLIVMDFLESDTGLTLKEICNRVYGIFQDFDSKNHFIDKLEQAGYNYFEDYSNLIKVNFLRMIVFNTKKEGFPILKIDPNPRIADVKYSINIKGLETTDFIETLSIIQNQLGQN